MADPSRRVLVTGATSGIGRAIVLECLGRGHRVSGCGRRQERLDELDHAAGPRAERFHHAACDVNDPEQVEAWLAAAGERLGGIDALVHNAGFGVGGPLEALAVEDYRRQFETNFFAVVDLTLRVLPLLRAQGGGDIVMISSVLGMMTLPGRSPYCASKWALEGFSHSIRPELRRRGIRVSVVNPGATESEFSDAMDVVGTKPPEPMGGAMSAETVARVVAGCLGRVRRNVPLTLLGRLGVRLQRWAPWLLERVTERDFLRHLDRSRR